MVHTPNSMTGVTPYELFDPFLLSIAMTSLEEAIDH